MLCVFHKVGRDPQAAAPRSTVQDDPGATIVGTVGPEYPPTSRSCFPLAGAPCLRVAHRRALQRQLVRAMNQAVADRIGDTRLPDRRVPGRRRQLTGDKGGLPFTPIFNDLQECWSILSGANHGYSKQREGRPFSTCNDVTSQRNLSALRGIGQHLSDKR